MEKRLNIPSKQTGDLFTATEFNAIVDAINAIDSKQVYLEAAFQKLMEQQGYDGKWLVFRGSTTIGRLPASAPEYEGWVYAVSGPFTSRADFVVGAGTYYERGAWVACVMRENDDGSVSYLWDILPDVVSPGGDPIDIDTITIATEEEIRLLFSTYSGMPFSTQEGWELGCSDPLQLLDN